MGSVNLQVHLINIAYQIQYFTFWWSKISVVSKQNNQNIGGVSYKNCCFILTNSVFGIDIDIIMHS